VLFYSEPIKFLNCLFHRKVAVNPGLRNIDNTTARPGAQEVKPALNLSTGKESMG
jgi:hypothetical protein